MTKSQIKNDKTAMSLANKTFRCKWTDQKFDFHSFDGTYYWFSYISGANKGRKWGTKESDVLASIKRKTWIEI